MHTPTPDRETEARDQREFDDSVARNGKIVLQALAGAGIFAALLMSMIALNQSGEKSQASAQATTAQPAASVGAPAASAPAAKVIDLKVVPSSKLGPDGKRHDAFTQTEFAVKAGTPLTLRIDNTDNAPHSITSPLAGVQIMVQPGVHTYTLMVASRGRYQWYCMVPCDSDANGWAMKNTGFMSGYITAT